MTEEKARLVQVRDRDIFIVCRSGQRDYYTTRILCNGCDDEHGFTFNLLSGASLLARNLAEIFDQPREMEE